MIVGGGGHIGLGLSVRARQGWCITLALGQELLKIGFFYLVRMMSIVFSDGFVENRVVAVFKFLHSKPMEVREQNILLSIV